MKLKEMAKCYLATYAELTQLIKKLYNLVLKIIDEIPEEEIRNHLEKNPVNGIVQVDFAGVIVDESVESTVGFYVIDAYDDIFEECEMYYIKKWADESSKIQDKFATWAVSSMIFDLKDLETVQIGVNPVRNALPEEFEKFNYIAEGR